MFHSQHRQAHVGKRSRVRRFERRSVSVAQERDDQAILDAGLEPGESIVSVGSLLVAQMYEDRETVATGAPPIEGPDVN